MVFLVDENNACSTTAGQMIELNDTAFLSAYGGAKPVNATHQLQDLGQSLWLDNITRNLLTTNKLKRYIYDNRWITGLTSNPSIFDHAISHSTSYDDDICRLAAREMPTEAVFFELAVDDLTRAADLFEPVHWPPCYKLKGPSHSTHPGRISSTQLKRRGKF